MERTLLAVLGEEPGERNPAEPAAGPRLVDPGLPLLLADDLGVLRGEGVFETMRLAAGRPAFLDDHLVRLARSAHRLDIALGSGWAALATFLAGHWGPEDGVLRLVCTKGGGAYGLATPVPAAALAGREHGVTALTLSLGVAAEARETAPWLLGGVKSTSYAVNMAALRAAQQQGCDDAIFVSSDGEVLEAPTATVCWVREGRIVTPPPAVGILPGTTLGAVQALDRRPWDIRRAPVSELHAADEVLLLSSVRGVAPVVRLDGRDLAIGPVTRELSAGYEAAVRRA